MTRKEFPTTVISHYTLLEVPSQLDPTVFDYIIAQVLRDTETDEILDFSYEPNPFFGISSVDDCRYVLTRLLADLFIGGGLVKFEGSFKELYNWKRSQQAILHAASPTPHAPSAEKTIET